MSGDIENEAEAAEQEHEVEAAPDVESSEEAESEELEGEMEDESEEQESDRIRDRKDEKLSEKKGGQGRKKLTSDRKEEPKRKKNANRTRTRPLEGNAPNMFGTQAREFAVRDFMRQNVLTIDSGSKVNEAVKIMVDNDVACVVVVRNGKPQGIFTEEDLLRMLVRGQTPESTLVKDSMSLTIRSVTPDQTSQEAAKAMIEKKGRLLVLEAERVIGIVTSSDIVKVIYRTGRSFDISKVISRKVAMVDADSLLKDVIERMESMRIGSVIVTKDKIPYGIFTERDLLNKVLFLGTKLDTPVGQVSTFPLVMVQLGVDGREVAGGMVSRYTRRFPLTQDGGIVGIITARDLVEAYANLPREIEDQELARQAMVRYGELCPLCDTRIDSTGLCGCGAGGA